MTRKRLFVSLPAAAVLTTAGVVRAFNPQPEPPAFGMVGITLGQIAVLNVVNTQPPDPNTPPDPNQPPDPALPGCRMELAFVDGAGQAIKDSSGQDVKKVVELRAGMAGFLRLRASQILGRDELRKSIRAMLTQPPDPAQPPDPLSPNPCRRLVATLEIVSPFGLTQVLYVGQPPDPAIPEAVAR